MAQVIAIGYDDDSTAALAAREVRRLTVQRIFEPAGVAVTARLPDGRYRTPGLTSSATWDTLRGLVALGALAYRPMLGVAAAAAVGALARLGRSIDRAFEQDVRALVEPGTSALFLAVDKVIPDEAVELLSRFGGTVLRSSLSREAEHELDDALRAPALETSSRTQR